MSNLAAPPAAPSRLSERLRTQAARNVYRVLVTVASAWALGIGLSFEAADPYKPSFKSSALVVSLFLLSLLTFGRVAMAVPSVPFLLNQHPFLQRGTHANRLWAV
jgi:hypothetical protein